MIHTVKGFSIVVEGKVNDYLIFLVYFSLLFQLTFLIGICYVVGTILNTTDTKLSDTGEQSSDVLSPWSSFRRR